MVWYSLKTPRRKDSREDLLLSTHNLDVSPPGNSIDKPISPRPRVSSFAARFVCALSCLALFCGAIFATSAIRANSCKPPTAAKLESLEGKVWDSDVLMTANEQIVIKSFITPELNMLEWGSGASTLWFHRLTGQYYSIEHDAAWYNHTRPTVQNLPNVHTRLSSVNHEPFWAPGSYNQFKDYVHAVDDFNLTSIDRVLVDGRARVACAVYVLRHLHKNSAVFLHNYGAPQNWDQERGYVKVLQFYDVLAEIDSLIVLRPKPKYLGARARSVNISALYDP